MSKLNQFFDLSTPADALTFYIPFVAGTLLLIINLLSFITL